MQEELNHARSIGLSVTLGAVMGAAIGGVTGHAVVWGVSGIAAYIAISLVGGAWKRERNLGETSHEEREIRSFAVGDSQRTSG
jgi:outer membrane lipoprotein SlyB